MNVPAHGVVLLAAGASRRLGRTKQLLELDGETLVHRAARLALGTEPADAVVVLGVDAAAVAGAIVDLPLRHTICVDAGRGMGASLATGLAALAPHCAGALVLLCDQPGLDAVHLDALVTAWRQNPAGAAASLYVGVLGVPALLPRAWFNAVTADVDAGAQALLHARSGEVAAIANAALALDIDTEADLGRSNG